MALMESANLLSLFNRYAGRPASNDTMSDADKYARLTEAQQMVVSEMLAVVPNSLYPKVPYGLMPQLYPNAMTVATGTVTLSGADFTAGATLTATASISQFSSASVGRTYLITDPATSIPIAYTVTAYTSGTAVSVTAAVNTPASMQAVAITAWGLGSTASADGQVFTFGVNANDYPIMPMGKCLIFPTLASFPDFPWVEGYDYVNEGTQIRLPNNRTWNSTLYWYGVPQPNDITASAQPALFPEGSRELIVWKAVGTYGEEGGRDPQLAERMGAKYGTAFPRWCLAWKTQFKSGGAMASFSGLRFSEAGGSLNGQSWNQ